MMSHRAIPCRIHRRLHVFWLLEIFPYYHVQDSTMYFWRWFTVSISYTVLLLPLLPIDSVDHIRLGWMCHVRLAFVPVLLYSTGTCSVYMAKGKMVERRTEI